MYHAISAALFLTTIISTAYAEADDGAVITKSIKTGALNANAGLQDAAGGAASPEGFTLSGDIVYSEIGQRHAEWAGRGVRFLSSHDENEDGARAGSVSQTVHGISAKEGRWFRFRIRALAQDHFRVVKEGLFLDVEFFRDGGKNSLDHIKKRIYAQVEKERKDLRDKSTNENLGLATWRSYDLEFRTPFPEVDTFHLTAGFDHGAGQGEWSEFCIGEFELTRIPEPQENVTRTKPKRKTEPSADGLVRLGGRWHYDPHGGDRTPPREFDHTNADQLYYRTDRFETPFADNMTAWLRKGYLDQSGNLVKKDRFITDNVRLTFSQTHLIVRSHNLPNHPTAVFPDRWGALDGNPNYIREQNRTWFIPLQPEENFDRVAMEQDNANGAFPRGPIGIAINGVVFFNPFDADSVAAIWRLDRCCGHPSPGQEYHYHKYPVCVKSPWTDDGAGHSPLIGFAFDGFPIFGPYEAPGELAKDSKKNRLNAFNVHYDDQRGWHYHVTPGKFPHIIGGYWGYYETRNHRRPPRRPLPN